MPESVFLQPEKMAYLNEKPYLSFWSAYLAQISLERFFIKEDLVPYGNTGKPVRSSGDLRWLPHIMSALFPLEVGWAGP